MKLKYDFIIREIGQRYVAVAVGANAEDFHGIIKLNTSGRIMLEMMKNEISKEDLIAALMEKYEGTQEFFSGEIDKFVKTLTDVDALEL